MPRPKSDLEPMIFRLSPDDLTKLSEIATSLGLSISAGSHRGKPDRSEALRLAIRDYHARVMRKAKKTEA